METEARESFCILFQRELLNYYSTQQESKNIYKFYSLFVSEKIKITLIYMFENLPNILENTEISFIFLHQEFLTFLKMSGLVKMRGCRRVIVTDLFWDVKRSYQNGDMIFIKI